MCNSLPQSNLRDGINEMFSQPALFCLNLLLFLTEFSFPLFWQDDSFQQQWLPGSGPRSWTQLWFVCFGRVWWCHHFTDCHTSFGLSVIYHRHRVQPVSGLAQPLPGWYYDHHHWRDYCCFRFGFHHYLNDTIQGLQPPWGRTRKSGHWGFCTKAAEQWTRRWCTGPSPTSLCFKNHWQSGRSSPNAVQSHVA